MSDEEEYATPTMARPGSRRSGGRMAALAVALGALVIGGTGLGLALSDAGAATPPAKPAGCNGSAPRLTVQGSGQATATPDVLTAVFAFATTASTSASALTQNNSEVAQALAVLHADGVASGDTQTTGLTLQPQYAYPHGVPTLTGYQAMDTLSATLRDMTTAGGAIDGVVTSLGNAVQIQGLTFSESNPARVEDEARADAVHQAVAHAGAMAAAAGRKLGAVCSLTDDTQPSVIGPEPGLDFAQAGADKAAAVPVEPGTQTETDQVTLVYALERA